MKKLLAILLTLMLFISVIPASVFASEEINLAPAYEAMNTLDNAYAQLGVAVAAKNAYNGISGMSKILGTEAGGEALEEAQWFADSIQGYVDGVKSLKTGLSYETLFALVGVEVYYSYNEVGEDAGEDVANSIGEVTTGVTNSVAALVASVG